MRAKVNAIILLVAVMVGTPRLAIAEDAPTLSQRWEQITTVVKQTVTEWWNKFAGTKEPDKNRAVTSVPASGPNVPATANPVAPVAPPAGSTTAPASASAPAAAAVLAVAPPAGPDVESIKKAHADFKAKETFQNKTEGHAHSGDLKVSKKTGVPIYEAAKLKNIKAIPRLDVGEEPEISRQNFSLPDWDWKIKELQQVQKSPSPPSVSMGDGVPANVTKAPPVKLSKVDQDALDQTVTHEKVDRIDYKIKEVGEVDVKAFQQFTEDQIRMLVTKILFERGDRCAVVVGLADSLSSKKEFHNEAIFELGTCAKELKLHQVAFEKLSELIRNEDKEFGPMALKTLGVGLPIAYEQSFYEAAKGLDGKEEFFIDKKANNEIYYRLAKGAFRAGHYKTAEKWAQRVNPDSSLGPSAQYVAAISEYGAKERTQARATLEKLSQVVENSSDTVLKGLVDVDLARMDYTARKFDQALPLYLKMPKDHPLWVQALIEQGWTQLAVDDFAGAIGNMYSLHSPYFKVLFQPGSFVVRTIGYLNICQYGDAYKTMTKLETDYRDWQTKLATYMSPERTPTAAYGTVRTYLKSKSTTDVDGIPYQLVREAARGKDFLTIQEAINDKTDEMGLYQTVNGKIQKEKENVRLRAEQAKHRADQLAGKLAALQKTKASADQIEEMKKNIEKERMHAVPNRYELSVLEQSQQAFGHFQKVEQGKLMDGQHKLMADASTVLFSHFKSMQAEMGRVLENNEFLRYEIFAGSGENIRYQVAGGQVGGDSRLPASVKPQKMMNWAFDGEFWEDEIGNYRSSLKNNCPKNAKRGDEK